MAYNEGWEIMKKTAWNVMALRNQNFQFNELKFKLTRKSSCVNARGIPTAAYQGFHLLSCMRRGTPPHLGVLPWPGPTGEGGTWGGFPHWGTPWPGPIGGTQGGLHPVGVPPTRSDGGVVPEVGYPPVRPELGYPSSGPGQGTPPHVWTDWKHSLILRMRSVTILLEKTFCLNNNETPTVIWG